ncbi:putative SOS response-associated peptidase YedK [Bradyrhizobium sp. SBR1B]|nr:putative SOS response-associated peptidase YedK [Bradyrhizobium sp. SBR1B]
MEGKVTIDVFGFLTRDPNAEVKRVHPEAMPIILTREEDATSGCGYRGTRRRRCGVA